MRAKSLLASALAVFGLLACVGDDPIPAGGGVDGGGVPGTGATTCDAQKPCAAGPCVDGFCCDTACGGTCEACNVPGQEGRCTAVKGAPKHGACTGDATGPCAGSCDGTDRAACAYPEVACSTGSCAGGVAALVSTCKAGSCPAATSQTCALGCFEESCLGVKQVAGGYYHTCAVLTDKRLRCWGDNKLGQTGRPAAGSALVTTPQPVASLNDVVSVAATFQTTCALLGNGTVVCFGGNTGGQLGNGTVDPPSAALEHPTPTPVTGIAGATFLSGSSGGHFCAIVAGGEIKCWGSNSSGQLGRPSTSTTASTPVTVCQPDVTPCAPSSGATFVAGGDNHTCAIFAGGKVACWGGNEVGQLGAAGPTARPEAKYLVPALTATYLTAGNRITCAASDGTAKCWGGNGAGRIGNGTDTGAVSTPTSVCTKADCSTVLAGVTAVTTFDESSCALAGGAVKCWGTNSGGQLGDGNASTSQSYAATSAIAAGAVAVASGGTAQYAIVVDRANRDLRCWGQESSNQCGDGAATSMDRKTPVAPKW